MQRLRGHHVGLPYHRAQIDDPVRMSAWDRALRALVEPGMVVLDAGAGLGVLGMLAARSGARVHAVESTVAAEMAQALVAANGLDVSVVRADLVGLSPVEPVDLVLCDFIGRFLPDADLLAAVRASASWMKSDARFAPSEARLYVAPVADVMLPEVDRFDHDLLGLDLRAALPVSLHAAYQVQLDPAALCGQPVEVARLTPPHLPESVAVRTTLIASRSGLLRGIAGWFDEDLSPGVRLDTGPGSPTVWGQVLWPITAVAVQPGDEIRVELDATSVVDGVHFAWRVEVWRGQHQIARTEAESTPAFGQNRPAPASAAPRGDAASLLDDGRRGHGEDERRPCGPGRGDARFSGQRGHESGSSLQAEGHADAELHENDQHSC